MTEKKKEILDINKETAIYAGGCFWGVEYFMQEQKGVISVESGYIGGEKENPTYEEVCANKTGHAEAVRIVFDNTKINYKILTKKFFEIHDPTQSNRQGPDVGNQYRSEIFYTNLKQKEIAKELIQLLKDKGYDIQTKLTAASHFYAAESYHQEYYTRTGGMPYCHIYTKRF